MSAKEYFIQKAKIWHAAKQGEYFIQLVQIIRKFYNVTGIYATDDRLYEIYLQVYFGE